MASLAGKESTPGLPNRLSRGIDKVFGHLPIIGKDFLALPKVKRIRIGIGATVGTLVFTACVAASNGRLPAVTYYPTSTPRPTPTEALTPTPIQVVGPFDPTDTPRPIPTTRPTNTPAPIKPSDTPKPADTVTPFPTNTATPRPFDTAAPRPIDTATPKPTNVFTETENNIENANKTFAIETVKQTIKESRRPITSVQSGYSISGTKYSLDFWSLNEGTIPLYAKIDTKYNDPVKNAIGFKALATLVPDKASIKDIVAYRGLFENSSSIAQLIKLRLLNNGWKDVSINQKPEYFKLQSKVDRSGKSTLLVWDSRGLGENLSYYQENPFGALYNTADNPVSLNKMTLSDVIILLGSGLEGEEAQRLVALFLKP